MNRISHQAREQVRQISGMSTGLTKWFSPDETPAAVMAAGQLGLKRNANLGTKLLAKRSVLSLRMSVSLRSPIA
jgi:hypothetical protein